MDYDFTYTGAEIQAILDTAKKLKDSGYIFLGVATPSTNPGTPTQKVYYEAKQAGTYTNFGGVVLPDGMSLLIWNGSWTSETVMCGDGGVFDISVYKSTGGTLATFADLSAALDGGNNIPVNARKGGMSVKFVQSSDNKYVQCRYMSSSTAIADFTNVSNWQEVDKEAAAGSKNLIESGDVFNVKSKDNNQTMLIGGSYTTDAITLPPASPITYVAIPITLEAGRYIISLAAVGEGSPRINIYDENKQVLVTDMKKANWELIELNTKTNYLYISTDSHNSATAATLTFTVADEEFRPFQYGMKRPFLTNNGVFTSNPQTWHLQIPVNPGDVIHLRGGSGSITYVFLSSEIEHPQAGGSVTGIISSGSAPNTRDTVEVVPNNASILLLNVRSATGVYYPEYLTINGFDIFNGNLGDTIGGILKSSNGSTFLGIITPETTINTPTKKVFAIGFKNGTYSQFGSDVVVPCGSIGIFEYDSQWHATVVKVPSQSDTPSALSAQIANCINNVQANNLLSGKNGDSFVFVTDSHYPDNWDNGVRIAAAVSKQTNNRIFIHGGDFVTKNKTKSEFFNILRNYATHLRSLYGCDWRVLIGNHDNNSQDAEGDDSQITTRDDFYALMNKGFESEVVNPDRNLYYYWDNVNQNIRYVCFDALAVRVQSSQIEWFASIVQNAPSNSHIVIITHAMWNTKKDTSFYGINADLAGMCDAINTRGTYTFNSVNYDFSSITAKVSVILCGHIHSIKQEYYGVSQIPVIALEADKYEGSDIIYSQKIHFVDIDFTNGKIYIFTFGYQIDDSQSRDKKEYNIVI